MVSGYISYLFCSILTFLGRFGDRMDGTIFKVHITGFIISRGRGEWIVLHQSLAHQLLTPRSKALGNVLFSLRL